jgi:hypothetical protein
METSKDKEIIDIYKLMVIPRVMVMILWLISMADFVQFGILKLGRFDCVNNPPSQTTTQIQASQNIPHHREP